MWNCEVRRYVHLSHCSYAPVRLTLEGSSVTRNEWKCDFPELFMKSDTIDFFFFFWNKIEKYKWHPFFCCCSFDLSITIEVKFSPTYLLAICISSLIICRFMFFAHLSIRLVIFFLLTCKNFFFPYKLVQFVAIFWTVWFPPFIYFNSV